MEALQTLTALDLDRNELSSLPDAVCSLVSLQKLDLFTAPLSLSLHRVHLCEIER